MGEIVQNQEGYCKGCGKLLYSVVSLDELPRKLTCRHCGHVNITKVRKPAVRSNKSPKKAKEKPASKVKPKGAKTGVK